MFQGSIRILAIFAACGLTTVILGRLLSVIRQDNKIEWEFDLEKTLEELESHPEGRSSKVWQFERPGKSGTTTVEAA